VVSPVYNVLIAGAGQIGAFYDQPGDAGILSHAHAFSACPGFNLTGFVDCDFSRAEQAAAIWGGSAWTGLEQALDSLPVDVLCLAVPDEWHYDYLHKLADSRVKLIFAEKPLTRTWPQALEIRELYAQPSAPAVEVNYLRRFVPEFIDLRKRIQSGKLGSFLGGTAYYGKGLVHNGSHMIDLLRFLIGEIREVQPLAQEYDFYPDDASISGMLSFAGGKQVMLQTVDCRSYSVFELDLFFAQNRVRILDSGFAIEEYVVKDDELFTGYRRLEQAFSAATSLGQAMYLAAANIYDFLAFNKPLGCSLGDGCRVIEICQALQEGLGK
jgi:predicted dehydrogenase